MRSQRLYFYAWAALLWLGWRVESTAQTAAEIWQDIPATAALAARPAVTSVRTVVPRIGRGLRVTQAALNTALGKAPREFSGLPGAEFPLPMPDGTFARFAVEESAIMEPGLAARFPELKTYVARGIDDPGLSARLDVTPQGFHALVLGADGVSFYVDPYWRDDATQYIAYRRRDFAAAGKSLQCGVLGAPDPVAVAARAAVTAARPTGASLRTYRLAVSCTAEYAAAAGGGTLLGSLGAIVTTVNRVSAVYERDLAIRLRLVANQDRLIFLNTNTDGFTDNNPDLLLTQNQSKIDSIIGNANYDIGHVFSTGGGGLASLGVVGQTGSKAEGVTGSSNPVGDPYDIDFVAHEMGHQFGADHPFNGTTGSCSTSNRNGPTAYEPGSGSTIMAYAGLCAPQDLGPNSDDYFHTISYDQIDAYTSTAPGNVGAATTTGNTPPTVTAPAGVTIPVGTPFALTATATDPNADDVLTYCWEQFNRGAAQNPTATPRDNGSSPIFRSFDPTRKPTRIFPSLTYILNNANVPPATVNTYASAEFLPSTSRTMTFRVTVRDNRAGGGGTNYASTSVTSTTAAGPFAMTSQNTGATIAGGNSQTVTWSVANTTAAPVSCANVRITYSTDGGNTFPIVLATSTPNNGSAVVTIPDVATRQGRIKVEAVGNIFFDISNANLTVTSANTAPVLTISSNVTVQRGSQNATIATVGTVSSTSGPLTATILDGPADTAVSAAVSGANLVVTARADCSISTNLTSRTYPLTLSVADSLGTTTSATVNFIVQPNPAPTIGTYADVSVARNASVAATPSAAPADSNGNLGAQPISISPLTLPGGGTLSINQMTGAITATPTAASTLAATTVTVTVQDTCGAAVARSFRVTVTAAVVTTPTIVAGTASAPTAENCVPANGAADPAETVTVNFSLNNTGTGATSSLVATLQNTGGLTPGTVSQSYGVIAAAGTTSRAFTFTVSGGAACGSTITPTLQLQDGATNLGTVSFTIRLGVLQTSSGTVQNFDGVTAPALPSGWSSTVALGLASRWGTSSTSPNTSPNAVSASASTSAAETRLDSPAISIVGATAQISFRHRWDLEDGYDGGVLELSINGGTYQDVVAAGGSFAAGGYTGTIDATFSNPLANRSTWTGSANSAYTLTTVNLPASAAGQPVRLRWRLGSDSSTVSSGNIWRIDTITLTDGAYICCGAAPAVTSLLPASGVVDQAYSHTFTTSGTPPPVWTVTAGSLPAGLSLSTSGILAGTPTVSGIFSGLTVTAQNGLTPAGTQSFALTVANTFARFISTFGFGAGDAAADADPDRDGIANLGEYGQNLAPNVGSLTGLPTVILKNFPALGGDFLSMTFTRVTTATDLVYEVEASPNLVDWTLVASSTAGSAMAGTGFVVETGTPPLRIVEVRDTTAIDLVNAPRRFIRLRISKLP